MEDTTSNTLIDLSNVFFIVKFTHNLDYNMTLLNGSWIIGDHYLHVHCLVPNFMAVTTKKTTFFLYGFVSLLCL